MTMYRAWLIDHYNYWARPAIFSWPFKIAVGIFVLLVIWSLVWKGIALWKAAKNHSVPWFVALLLVNTLGILEILYIFVFSKWEEKEKPSEK